ncbi:DUF4091 domain-containing protein [Kribbella sandramycini]|uniref:DUF4091 domain-containing protein n=1 Tax=Kribbella sandramycini TaxID=60450 RepID=A0A7Y4P3P7_9ACTN|nr:glycoside hydrolase domain-containing protein [Kribbella sandramycini]MBB6570428.1 hypothetical protein [Kribbella sandramycini]NOL45288.1 DUF4091 domain-containing protein [Kribbella sandramycini]
MPDFAQSPPGRRQVLGWLTAGTVAAGLPLLDTRTANALAAAPAAAEAAPLTVWLPSPADKVRRDRRFLIGSAPTAINLAAARNEYESGQFIVRTTSGTTRLGVSAGILTGPGGAQLSEIEVFEQHYVQVDKTWPESQPKYLPGPWPDALAPLPPSRTVPVGSGSNQGIWFTVHIPKDQPAGTYTGTITLTGGTSPVSVPVEVEVWPFEIPDTASTATAAAIWYQQVARHYGLTHTDPRHEPMMRKYYELQKKYRLISTDPPGPFRAAPAPNGLWPGPGHEPEPAEFLRSADRYLLDPSAGRFRIPLYATGDYTVGFRFDAAKVRQVLQGLRERGIVDRGYFYWADEPLNETAYAHVKKFFADVSAVAPDIDHVLTLTDPPNQDLLDFVRAWCFVITVPKPELPGIVEALKARGDTVWWYTAWRHAYPLPSMFLADSSVSARLLPWIQYSHGIEGWLFWSTTVFGKWEHERGYAPSDRWTDPFPLPGGDAGDGYLMYPGPDGPVPSIRLDNLRDGFEDLEYLALYDRKSAELAAGWELPVPAKALQSYHDVLHTGPAPYRDDPALFHRIRRQVGAEVAQLFGSTPAVVRIERSTAHGVVVELSTGRDNPVSIGGNSSRPVQTTATGARHRVVVDLPAGQRNLTITVAGSTFTRTLDVRPVAVPHDIPINSFETPTDVARLITQEASATWSDQHAGNGQHAAKLTFNTNAADPARSGVYFHTARENRPDHSIGRIDWSKIDAVAFDAYNDSDDVAVIYCDFHDPVRLDDGNPFYLSPRKQQRVVIPLAGLVSDLSRITSIHLRTPKRRTPLTVFIDNLHFQRSRTDLPVPGTWSRQDADRKLTVQTVRADGSIRYLLHDGAGWTATSIPAGVTGTVASALDPAGQMNLFALTAAGVLKWSRNGQQLLVDPTPTNGPKQQLTGRLAAIVDATGRMTYFARSVDGHLIHGRQRTPGSTEWTAGYITDGGGAKVRISDDPTAAPDVSGKLTYLVRNLAGQLWHGWEGAPGNNQWSGDLILQGGTGEVVRLAGRPAMAQDVSGRLTFHARGAAGAYLHGWQSVPGGGPWRWEQLPLAVTVDGTAETVALAGDPVSALDASGKLVTFVHTTDGRIFHNWQRHPGHGPWEGTVIRIGTTYVQVNGDGAVGQDSTGVLHYFAPTAAGALGHWYQHGPGVGPWHSGALPT